MNHAANWLLERAEKTPERVALLAGKERLDFAALLSGAARRADALRARGVRPGQLVAMWLPGGAEGVLRLWGAWLAGARVLPMNQRLTESETAHLLASVRPDHRIGEAEALPGDSILPKVDTADDIALVLFTSGTAGPPKAACLRHANLWASARGSAKFLGVREDDRWLACLPLFHVGGLMILVRSVLDGSGVVLQSGFDAERVNASLDSDGITLASFVPTTLRRLLEQRTPDRPPGSLRTVLLGGAAAPESLVRRARQQGFPIRTTYGLTEASSQVATSGPEDEGAGFVGHPLPGTQLRIVDAAGRPRAQGEEGEVCVRGPNVFAGYLGDLDATNRVLRDGWLHTGDRGRLAADGCLWMLGRRNDLIVSGGENVHPGEVEAALLDHASVAEVAVAGLPDPDLGERVVAWVVPRLVDEPPSVAELGRFARKSLAGYKLPREIRFVPALPRNAMGKVLRRELEGLEASEDG